MQVGTRVILEGVYTPTPQKPFKRSENRGVIIAVAYIYNLKDLENNKNYVDFYSIEQKIGSILEYTPREPYANEKPPRKVEVTEHVATYYNIYLDNANPYVIAEHSDVTNEKMHNEFKFLGGYKKLTTRKNHGKKNKRTRRVRYGRK